MFSASWKAPMLQAPSPKKQTATRSSPRSLAVIPAPVATGRPAPMMTGEPIMPSDRSIMWMDPPIPPQTPLARPMISAKNASSPTPRDSAWWWPR